MSSTAALDRRHQLDVFPAHSEPLDRDPQFACLLDDRCEVEGTTLASIIGNGDSSSVGSPSPSVTWKDDGVGDGLARRALRGRERWAYWRASSGPAAASSSEEEVACSAARSGLDLWRCAVATRVLALKLDYEEILAAWSDQGPLFMDGDAPQVVPQLHRHGDLYDFVAFPVLVEVGQGGGDAVSTWKVPEKEDGEGRELKGEDEAEGVSLTISREARVQRYKEKRVNRLFAKRIRYEVRKMNAEKRPRIKGRFVKRNDDDEDQS